MAYLYLMSDPHGCLDALERALAFCDLSEPDNRVFLLGDYVPHKTYADDEAAFIERCSECLVFVKGFCEEHPGQVVALMGNHERDLLDDVREGRRSFDRDLVKWMRSLPLFHETEWQILVHAGIDEEAGDLWRIGTDEGIMLGKHPATFGAFDKDIVAGHNGTYKISKMAGESIGFNGALWDGQSHYFIDGSTERSGVIPLLRFDTEARKYAAFSATAKRVACDGAPYVPRNLDSFAEYKQDEDWW